MHHRISMQQKTQLGYGILFSVSNVDHLQYKQQHQVYSKLTEFICVTVIYPSLPVYEFIWKCTFYSKLIFDDFNN